MSGNEIKFDTFESEIIRKYLENIRSFSDDFSKSDDFSIIEEALMRLKVDCQSKM